MDRYEQFRRAAIEQGIPDDEVGRFAEHLRFEISARGADPGEEVVGQSGGLPRLPVGVEWPGGGSPLPFIGSVDCAALPRAEGLPLPEDGSLLFFLHHEEDLLAPLTTGEQPYARALYVPAGTETVVASPPPGHDSARFFHEDLPFLIPEHQLAASVRPVLPEWIEESDYDFDSLLLEQLFDDLKHADELCELVDALWPAQGRGGFLRIGGYCSEIGGQDPPLTQMEQVGFGGLQEAGPSLPGEERFTSSEKVEYRLTREWVPLAQFYTESDYYYGCFLISFDDLAAKRFDRMLSFTMFTE